MTGVSQPLPARAALTRERGALPPWGEAPRPPGGCVGLKLPPGPPAIGGKFS